MKLIPELMQQIHKADKASGLKNEAWMNNEGWMISIQDIR